MAATAPEPAAGGKDRRRGRKTIKSTVTVHDRTQIETVFDYTLPKGQKRRRREDAQGLRYEVEAFLFFPRQFGLDAQTYPKERFYNDIRPLIRFREPRLGYRQIMGLKEPDRSPILFLKSYMDKAKQGRLIEPVHNAIDEVRLFACAYVSVYVRDLDRTKKRFNRLARQGGLPDDDTVAEGFVRALRAVDRAHRLLLEYRRLFELLEGLPAEVQQPLGDELRLVDEYCYYRIRDGLAQALVATEEMRGCERVEAVAFHERVKQIMTLHDDHAERCGYIRIETASPVDLRERYLHRRGELKRRIWQVLFLQIRQVPMFRLQRQFGAMVAAGAAALWAVIAQVLLVRKALLTESQVDLWGLSGFLFLTAAVLAYVIKDRIKELGRGYFGRGIFRRIPDHSEQIYCDNRVGEPIAVGLLRETTRFLQLREVPKEINALRERVAASDALEDEAIDHVLHYTKDIELSGTTRILNRYPLRSVHDILRLNIEACLSRLGEPTRLIAVAQPNGTVHSLAFPKVYYLDMVLRYSRLDERRLPTDAVTEYFRLVLDKTGLLRVERMS